MSFVLHHYVTSEGDDVFIQWLSGVRDRVARAQVANRVNRLERGNFGDHRFCREGVWELRLDTGPGYRVYYARDGEKLILLLGGGDKRTQDRDIERAIAHWRDWQRRSSR